MKPPVPLRFHRIKQVAEALEVDERTVRRWRKSGKLKAHVIGSVIRISDEDLRSFIALHRDQ